MNPLKATNEKVTASNIKTETQEKDIIAELLEPMHTILPWPIECSQNFGMKATTKYTSTTPVIRNITERAYATLRLRP